MNHRIQQRKLNRTSAHRRAMLRNMAQSMIEHGQVCTTIPKAKTLRPFIERLVTLARRAHSGNIVARRRIHRLLTDRSMIPEGRQTDYDDLSMAKRRKALRAATGRRYRLGQPVGKLAFTGQTIAHRLINTVAPKFEDHTGGYTRIVKLSKRRLGDGGQLAIVQFVGDEKSPGSIAKPGKTSRRRRADARYALAVQLGKASRAGKSGGGSRERDAVAPDAGDGSANEPDVDVTAPDSAE